MSTLLRRLLPAFVLLSAVVAAFAAPGAARPHGNDEQRPEEMSTATPPPFHPNLQLAFGSFALGATRAQIDRASGVPQATTAGKVTYAAPDGEEVTVSFVDDSAAEIHVTRPLDAKGKAVLSTSDGIRLGAPIDAALPLYGPPDTMEAGNGPGYTIYAWRMQGGRSVAFQTFLGRIVSVDLLPPQPYPSGVSVGNGGGSSESDAVAITAPSEELAVQAEFEWLSRIDCGAAGFRFAFEKNLSPGGRRLEAIGLYCGEDQRVYLFDVTGVAHANTKSTSGKS